MLDAFTTSMSLESWGRISFARALVEISSESELKHEVTMAIPKEDDSGFISACIKVEYEWKPPHCAVCKIFGHDSNSCPKKDVGNTSNAPNQFDVPPTSYVEEKDDGFKEVQPRKGKGKGKKQSTGINIGKWPKFAPLRSKEDEPRGFCL